MSDARVRSRCCRWGRLLIVAVYLAAAVLYGLYTPIYEGPDEIGHILYVKHISEGLGIPVQSREYAIAYGFGQEGSQSPLYYALNAALVRASGLSLREIEGLPAANPFTTCGRPDTGQNVAGYRHDPLQETFPYRGAARAVHVMRLLSAALGLGTIASVYAAAGLLFPRAPLVGISAMALVALNPQFAFMGGVVNNDNLVNCLTGAAIALTLYCLRRGFTWRRSIALGAVCGLAPLAKLGGLLALVAAALGLALHGLERWRSGGRDQRASLGHAALVLLAFLSVAGWWFVRNWRLYGDPTGTNTMLSIYGGRRGWPWQLVVPEILATFRSYWGVFACGLHYPGLVYWLFGLLVALGTAGAVRGWRALPRTSRSMVALLLVWMGSVVALWVRWNQITYAPLGRLFFQANAAVAPVLGFGLVYLTRQPRYVVMGTSTALAALTLVGALCIVRPAFALPDRYPSVDAPSPPRILPDATFGDLIRVPGYGLSSDSLEPGETLDVTLHLQAIRAVADDYLLALQLASPVAGDEAVLANFNTYPGGGAYGTYAWLPGEVVVDRYRVQVPKQVERAQAWRLMATFYRPSDGERLPVSVAGQPAGESLGLGLVRVGASAATVVPVEARLSPAALFGGVIALDGARVSEADGSDGALAVVLWWRSLGAPDGDFTVFVHLTDGAGQLVSTGDGPPLEGGFPTFTWRPGDQVLDEHMVHLPADSASQPYTVRVGWYDRATGARLRALRADQELADGAVVVGQYNPP